MNFRDLEYFQQLSRVLSFTQVAKSFAVSQPTITQAVKRLEAYFDTALLIRNPHTNSVRLTAAGRQLMQTADEVLSTWQRNREVIKRMTKATLLIGIEPTISERYLLAIINALQAAGLFSHVRFVEAGSLVLGQKLAVGAVDAIIVGEIGERAAIEQAEYLVPIHFHLLANSAHPLTQQTHVAIHDTLQYPVVTQSENFLNHQVFDRLYHGLTPQVLFESDNAHVVLDAVAANTALGFLADLIKLPANVVPLPLVDVKLPQTWVTLRYRSDRQLTQFTSLILQTVASAISGQPAADDRQPMLQLQAPQRP
ncbi:LysR family transcriptional regulator [Lacticaseibacillus jixiensis]|uniref:LysR family transcriptional regulator n=1 Tax=Lacticaseibacillus jixiensis TaxID=3231926 RepID=UPI0036F352D0